MPIISDIFFSGKYSASLLHILKEGMWNASIIFGYTVIVICLLYPLWQYITGVQRRSVQFSVPKSACTLIELALRLFAFWCICAMLLCFS